ncbi:hypothetical protein PVAP13_5NG310473 [Panicum virgatum]|uniref:Uncharacterized protein n=1 Tax=Panicum virgatum TaxID=38727 RepID=A0A8T0RUK0_PANVG|nr:hypothetical protein PVAP13_5NG310473 [Panicum virgatum]
MVLMIDFLNVKKHFSERAIERRRRPGRGGALRATTGAGGQLARARRGERPAPRGQARRAAGLGERQAARGPHPAVRRGARHGSGAAGPTAAPRHRAVRLHSRRAGVWRGRGKKLGTAETRFQNVKKNYTIILFKFKCFNSTH